MRYFNSIIFFCVSLFCALSPIEAAVKGKVDVAAAYFRIKLKENKKTRKRVDMGGGRIDSTIRPCEGYGVCFRPFFQGGVGDHSHFWTGGIGLGHYTPITDKICLLPTVGYSHGRLKTHIKETLPAGAIPNLPAVSLDFKNTFRSNNAYLGLDIYYKFSSCFYVTFVGQYAWAYTNSEIEQKKSGSIPNIGKDTKSKGWSRGPNLGLTMDYYFTDCLALNAAVGYNYSMDKDKIGIVGMGAKLGIGYFF